MSDNAQQVEYWNGPAGEKWATQQAAIDANLSSITAALMPFAAARAGERVLDIGCGCGTTSLMLSKAVSPNGTVTGVDIFAPMLAVARARGGPNFLQADAALHRFKPTHDLIFSRFGVMFFADPAAAFANIHKAARAPGGRLAFVCWRAFPENPWAFAPFAAARDLLLPQETPDPNAPGPFAFADAARMKSILESAGFRDVRIEKLDSTMNMGTSLEEASAQALAIGPLARAAAEVDEAMREKIRERVVSVLEKFKTPSGIAPPAACWLVGARD